MSTLCGSSAGTASTTRTRPACTWASCRRLPPLRTPVESATRSPSAHLHVWLLRSHTPRLSSLQVLFSPSLPNTSPARLLSRGRRARDCPLVSAVTRTLGTRDPLNMVRVWGLGFRLLQRKSHKSLPAKSLTNVYWKGVLYYQVSSQHVYVTMKLMSLYLQLASTRVRHVSLLAASPCMSLRTSSRQLRCQFRVWVSALSI